MSAFTFFTAFGYKVVPNIFIKKYSKDNPTAAIEEGFVFGKML